MFFCTIECFFVQLNVFFVYLFTIHEATVYKLDKRPTVLVNFSRVLMKFEVLPDVYFSKHR